MADKQREIVLAPGQYCFIQDGTKGAIKTFVGPIVVTPTGQDGPVRYNPETGLFEACSLELAIQKSPIAVENDYMILKNPAIREVDQHPGAGTHTLTPPDLQVGHKIILRGPQHFALWPGQAAERIRGHKLRSNQYLLCRVYDAEAARKNWSEAIAKKITISVDEKGTKIEKPVEAPEKLTVGTEFVIKGTEVSFYIPPTGVTVLKDSHDVFIRDAVTLERMEYCVLIDENGRKRYERGPSVVFPEPTEKFMVLEGKNKLPAIELNELQGIHIKVIADYSEKGKTYSVGEELFVTGKETQIYYPREEHALVSYDGKAKHFATAIPAGEGRYVMNRMTGEIKMVKGPGMVLPDPRTEVFVKRVLDLKDCDLWYPGNLDARTYNEMLNEMVKSSPSTRAGTISEGDYERKTKGNLMRSGGPSVYAASGSAGMDRSLLSGNVAAGQVADKIDRGSSYTSPRTLTLNTKYEGVPAIEPWIGFAVLVKSKKGNRRVVTGPDMTLMEYDETLESLNFSTGKPKTTDNMFKTVYLQVSNNKVSDLIEVETSDHVKVKVKVAYRADFTGDDKLKWFSVSNYVKLLCDHGRSLLKGAVLKMGIRDFYQNTVDVVRDTLLGKSIEGKRQGMTFEENGLHVKDVEVLEYTLMDPNVAGILTEAQRETFTEMIKVERRRDGIQREIALVDLEVKLADKKTDREKHQYELNKLINDARYTQRREEEAELKRAAEASQARETEEMNHRNALLKAQREEERLAKTQNIDFREQEIALDEKETKVQTESVVKRFEAARDTLGPVLLAMSSRETLVKIAEATSVQKMIGGDNAVDVFHKLFDGTPVEGIMSTLKANIEAGNLQLPGGKVEQNGKSAKV